MSHDLLMNSKVSSVGVLRYLEYDVSEPSWDDQLRYFDKIEPLIYVAIGAMVLVLALGIFVPMWDIAQLAGR